jgi:chemotaxis protein methyltransferase CheR
MEDDRCIAFLSWALPRLHLRWPGFRKVRKQVCKRLGRRLKHLGLRDVDEYRAYLHENAAEWAHFDALCRITISRFNRDREMFRKLEREVLPVLAVDLLARGESTLRIWSAGCAGGEEPYTLAILWHHELEARFPGIGIDVVATDVDLQMLGRARAARYDSGSLKELPAELRDRAFAGAAGGYLLKPRYRRDIRFCRQDIRRELPDGRFDLVLCRNLVFTYFDAELQKRLARSMIARLRAGGALVIGAHERLPEDVAGLLPWFPEQRIYRKSTCGS